MSKTVLYWAARTDLAHIWDYLFLPLPRGFPKLFLFISLFFFFYSSGSESIAHEAEARMGY